MAKVEVETTENGTAITGQATGSGGVGVLGEGAAVGVRGNGKSWHGVAGISESTTGGYGVYGKNTGVGTGVGGESDSWMGVYGKSNSTTAGAGVMGEGVLGGVIGKSTKWNGVYGETDGIENGPAGVWGEHKGAGVGVKAKSQSGVALVANSVSNVAVHAETNSPANAAIAAYNLNPAGTGAAIYAKKAGKAGDAGFFEGNVAVTGTLSVQGIDVLALLHRAQQLESMLANNIRIEPGYKMIRTRSRIRITSDDGRYVEANIPDEKLTKEQQQDVIDKTWEKMKAFFNEKSEDIKNGNISAADIGGILYGTVAGVVLAIFGIKTGVKWIDDLIILPFVSLSTGIGRYYGSAADELISILKGKSKPTITNVITTLATFYIVATELPVVAGGADVFGIDAWSLTKKVGEKLDEEAQGALNEIYEVVGDVFDAGTTAAKDVLDFAKNIVGL
jgi:hypothetical protein